MGIEPTRDSLNHLSSGLKPEPITRQISLPKNFVRDRLNYNLRRKKNLSSQNQNQYGNLRD